MSKRKKNDPNPEEEEEGEVQDEPVRPPQKVYDFHKKTIEVYPERLRELNRQFLASVSSQITTEPYSVLVGNCLDYVRQYFNYEDDLLQYTPWLAARLKQSHSDIGNCLQDTIDLYDALARQDFDRLFEKKTSEKSKIDQISSIAAPSFAPQPVPIRAPASALAPVVTTSASASKISFGAVTTTANTTAPAPAPPPTTSSSTAPFQFNLSSTSNTTSPSSGFTFQIPSSSSATTTTTTTTTNASPFSFSLPNTGFGTTTFASPSSTSTEKSTLSFAPPPKFSFTPTPAASEAAAADENEDESAEPPEPEKVDHESNAKYTYRCRMGVTKGSKFVKRGPVQVVLKEANDKNQLIVRSDDSLGRLFLNIIWSKMISMKKNAAKDLTFVCALNPGMAEIPEGEFVTILFRFDNETERNVTYDQLEKELK